MSIEPLSIGRAALQRGQWGEARDAFERALAIEQSPEAVEGLGWALFWLEQPDASFERREEAYRLYLQRGDPRSAARVATNLAIDYSDFAGFAVAAGWLQRARRLLEPLDDGPEHGWLALWEGHLARLAAHDTARARELAREAIESGRRHGVPDLELLALALEGLILVHDGSVSEGMRQLDEATAAALAGEMAEIDSVAQTCCLLVHACERVRDYDRAAQWSQRIDRFAARYSTGSMLALCRVQHAAMLIGLGRWREAEELIEASREILSAKRPLMVDEALVQMAELRRRQGRWEEAEEIFRRHETYSESMLGLAAISVGRGDAAGALAQLQRFARKPLAEKWVQRAVALGMTAEANLMLADVTAARSALAGLIDLAATIDTDVVRAIHRESEGMLHSAAGDHEAARAAMEDAIDLFSRASAPYESARARLRLADVLWNLGRQARAADEARSSAEVFQSLGAAQELARAREFMQRRAPGARIGGPLTPRESEVLTLVARGMSDKEVAASLRLSEHTVHRHVSNILSKLKLPSRAAAVAEASRLGLLRP